MWGTVPLVRCGLPTQGWGFLFLSPEMSRLMPRATWRQEKVKTPTLTSNSATLGSGTLEILVGMEDSAHPTV